MLQEGMVLGGTMTLEGQGLMLTSFHGVNFRAKYWALFNIKEPYIHFSTEAQRVPEGGKANTIEKYYGQFPDNPFFMATYFSKCKPSELYVF